jgi:putative heme-binding domain-containing protein
LDQFAEPLAKAFTSSELSDAVRNAIAQALQRFPEKKDLLVGLFKTASTRQQSVLAEVLVSTNEGAKKLCEMAPPRLLTQPNIASKLAALNDTALNKRIAELTKDLPPASAELDALLAGRLKGFLAAQASGAAKAEAGQAVFLANCANCHQLAGKGAVVGPQLDGTKNRGAERLCEDILDPNRAVDPVFHLHILKLKDNSVLAGLQRREEGATLVLADAAGQEHRVEKSSITENTESALSLMPAAFGQSIPEADFYHLLAYLLKQ